MVDQIGTAEHRGHAHVGPMKDGLGPQCRLAKNHAVVRPRDCPPGWAATSYYHCNLALSRAAEESGLPLSGYVLSSRRGTILCCAHVKDLGLNLVWFPTTPT